MQWGAFGLLPREFTSEMPNSAKHIRPTSSAEVHLAPGGGEKVPNPSDQATWQNRSREEIVMQIRMNNSNPKEAYK